jgi:hypothetical protein
MIHWTAHYIASLWITQAADCRWIVIGVLLVVRSSLAADPESRLWITSWSFGTRADEEVDGTEPDLPQG